MEIGFGSFSKCRILASVSLPRGLVSIGTCAFFGCPRINSVVFPPPGRSQCEIGGWSFARCLSLVKFPPATGSSVGIGACWRCAALTEFTVCDGATYIGECAFAGCESLVSFTMSSTVDTIMPWAFAGCEMLATFTIPPLVREIQKHTFRGCTGLVSVSIPPGVREIQHRAFDMCASLTSITIPPNVTVAGYAFWRCGNLTSVTIQSTGGRDRTELEANAFAGCVSLRSLTIASSGVKVSSDAFEGVVLTDVTLIGFQLSHELVKALQDHLHPSARIVGAELVGEHFGRFVIRARRRG